MEEKKNHKKKNLEETIKDKVLPLLEDSMEKVWGMTIPKIEEDVTDKLKTPIFDFYVPNNLNFNEAKKFFKKEFLKKELKINRGNISQLAKKLGLDRRSLHRAIKEFDIDMEEVRAKELDEEDFQKDIIDQKLRSTLDQYKEIIQPQKMEKMYEEIGSLSRNIAKFLPPEELTWKEAEMGFEKQFFTHALEKNNGNVMQTAKNIEIRSETLHRKIKKLGIRK